MICPSFQPNEVVWAKITGYPWWPAQVSRNLRQVALHTELESQKHRNMVKVFFFGDNSQYSIG
jgi:hypothetical protein